MKELKEMEEAFNNLVDSAVQVNQKLKEKQKENEKLEKAIKEALCYIYEVENVALFEKKNVMDTNKLKRILEGKE